MKSNAEKVINILLGKINLASSPEEALKYTQAALNLAHMVATFSNII